MLGPSVSRICSPASSMSQQAHQTLKIGGDFTRLRPIGPICRQGECIISTKGLRTPNNMRRSDAALRPWQSHLVVPLAAIDRGVEAELPLRCAGPHRLWAQRQAVKAVVVGRAH